MPEIKAFATDGIFNFILTKDQEAVVLAKMAETYGKAKAEQEELAKVYDAKELRQRLKIKSLTTIYKLLESGELKCMPIGKKGYRVSEIEVRRFLGVY